VPPIYQLAVSIAIWKIICFDAIYRRKKYL